MSRTSFRAVWLLGLVFAASQAVAAESPWQADLLSALKSRYAITTRNWLGKIQQPGVVLVVQQEGLQADRPKPIMRPTEIQDGVLVKTGAGGIVMGTGARSLKKGERVHVYDIRVKDEYVLLLIGTVDTVDTVQNGSTTSAVQEAALSFASKEAPLATTSADAVIAQISKWLVTESEATAARTVALGQSVEDVIKALGQPTKIVDLGPKKVYYYPDMKVIFQDGKVADVQ